MKVGTFYLIAFVKVKNFFNRFGADMVVVNGVDAQTNSHQTGRLYNWTGSNAEGRPSLTALHAAANTPDQPLAYSVYGGGTSRTAGIITYNRFDDVSRLRELTRPTQNPWNPDRQIRPDLEISEAQRLAAESITRMLARPDLTPRQRRSLTDLQSAREGREGLARLSDQLPPEDEFEQPTEFQEKRLIRRIRPERKGHETQRPEQDLVVAKEQPLKHLPPERRGKDDCPQVVRLDLPAPCLSRSFIFKQFVDDR